MPSSDPGYLDLELTSLDPTFTRVCIPVLLEVECVDVEIADSEDLELRIGDQTLELKVEDPEIQILTLEQGLPGRPGTPGDVAIELGTAGVVAGHMVYALANGTVAHTDARYLPQALALGAFAGTSGIITTLGKVEEMVFSNASPTPTVGQRVYLARADDEPADGAAGKVTVTLLTVGFVAPVGIVVSVQSDFGSTRIATVAVRVFDVFGRPA